MVWSEQRASWSLRKESVHMLSRVLVPLDGSPVMTQILPTLRQMLGGTGAAVHLLVVRQPVQQPLYLADRVIYLDELLQQEQAAWQDYLTRQAGQLAYDGIVVQRTVRFGDPLTEILAVAHGQSMHLIALIARPEPWPQRLFRPSLAHQLLVQSPVPVLVVPAAHPPSLDLVARYSGVPV
jgi:nucleotide-binding universal stress UspA family protein